MTIFQNWLSRLTASARNGPATITPASGYVPPRAAIIIGAAAGTLCYFAVNIKDVPAMAGAASAGDGADPDQVVIQGTD